MSKIKIETITPVHIGSGNLLQYGTDFVCGEINKSAYLGVIDDRKTLQFIGEKNIDKWVQSIERNESTVELVKRYAPNAKFTEFSKRLICNFVEIKSTDTLKECMHNGFGLPYIPGSSIKGSIRTALLATLSNTIFNKEGKIISGRDKKGNNKVSASKIEKELFGKDPNSDIFRFLQVGDAYFQEQAEISLRVVNLNIRQKQSFWDTSKSQLIEAIGLDESTDFEIKINNQAYNLARGDTARMPQEMHSLTALFSTINMHTKKLVEQEIKYWKDFIHEDNVNLYIDKMNDILECTNHDDCQKGKSCVLRIGHASGWRFITGAWAENLTNFNDVVVPAARPRNNNYLEYDFPKSRRLDEDCDVLGFVKLSIIEE